MPTSSVPANLTKHDFGQRQYTFLICINLREETWKDQKLIKVVGSRSGNETLTLSLFIFFKPCEYIWFKYTPLLNNKNKYVLVCFVNRLGVRHCEFIHSFIPFTYSLSYKRICSMSISTDHGRNRLLGTVGLLFMHSAN